MKTMKEFLDNVQNQKIAKAVIKQLGGWDEFKANAKSVAENGIDGGFHGFIYYADTVAFAEKNWDEIEKLAQSIADDLGEDSIYQMFSKFRCINDMRTGQVVNAIFKKDNEDHEHVMNCLAWFAGEEVCHWYNDLA